MPPAADLECDALADEGPIAFAADGRVTSLGLGGPELLRDLGGGGMGARRGSTVGRSGGVALSRCRSRESACRRCFEPCDGSARRGCGLHARPPRTDGRWPGRAPRVVEIAATSFGAFELQLSASNDLNTGTLQVLGVLRRRIPRLLAVACALVAIDAPGREIELGLQLCTDKSFAEVAAALGIAPASAKTLLNRLGARFATSGREHVLEAMVQMGCRIAR